MKTAYKISTYLTFAIFAIGLGWGCAMLLAWIAPTTGGPIITIPGAAIFGGFICNVLIDPYLRKIFKQPQKKKFLSGGEPIKK